MSLVLYVCQSICKFDRQTPINSDQTVIHKKYKNRILTYVKMEFNFLARLHTTSSISFTASRIFVTSVQFDARRLIGFRAGWIMIGDAHDFRLGYLTFGLFTHSSVVLVVLFVSPGILFST